MMPDSLAVFDRERQPTHALRDMLAGRPAFLIGGGPSANSFDMSQLQRRGLWSMAVNNVAGHFRVNSFVCSDPPSKFHDLIWRDPSVMKFVPLPKLTTLGAGNLSEFLDQIQYNNSVQEKIYQLQEKIKDIKAKLEKQQNELKIQLSNLEELKHQLEITKQSISEQRNQRQLLLNQTRGLESNYQKLLAQSKKEESDLEKEIEDLDSAIRTKLGNRTIKVSKGILAWPMDGVLTQKYGNTGFTALGYNFHNGIDIAAPAGQPIYAVYDGEVLYTDSSDASYGNWVAIKHNLSVKNSETKIITLYAHMRSIKVKVGAKVKQGDIIGYEGNTGNTTKKLYGPERGYHIHFGVYDAEGFGVKEGKYQNIYGPYKIPFGYTYNPLDFL
jgi:murein DD-endopeptidase MepM/ murein hydrolase activator NlpD